MSNRELFFQVIIGSFGFVVCFYVLFGVLFFVLTLSKVTFSWTFKVVLIGHSFYYGIIHVTLY